MKKVGMPFMQLPKRSVKPREKGLTLISDKGIGYVEAESFLEGYSEYVDYVKFFHVTPALVPEELTKRKTQLYRDNGVTPFAGGIVLELAHCQGQMDEAIAWLWGAGFRGVEFSDNIVFFTPEEKQSIIKKCIDAGMEVIYEYGRKYYKEGDVLTVDEIAEEIEWAVGIGAKRIILEESVLDLWLGKDGKGKDAHKLKELSERVGEEKIIYEVSDKKQTVALLKLFGPDVNFGPNIDPPEVMWLEPGRRGIGRAFGYNWVSQEYERFKGK